MKLKLLKSNKGFTLLELVITLFLTSLVFLIVFQMIHTSMAVYRTTTERVDAQGQFRLIVGILEQEVGTATSVQLLTEVPEVVEDGFACLYVKADGEVGKFYKKTSEGEREYITPFPLKNLTMTFERATSKDVLTVNLQAAETNNYTGNIYTQNTDLFYADTGTVYTVIYYKVLDETEL